MKSFDIKKRGLSPFFLVVIACVVCAIYSNSLHVPFALDDSHTIQNNERIKDLSHFSSPAKFLGARAVVNFTFALNYRFGGLDVIGYHLVNILIHCANGFMVYFLSLAILGRLSAVPYQASSEKAKEASKTATARRKKGAGTKKRAKGADEGKDRADRTVPFPRYTIALFAALIFVAHPLQTQAVTYIAQRYTSLAAFFYLGAVLFYLKGRTAVKNLNVSLFTLRPSFFFALVFVFSILAFLSKQTAASLPLAVVLVEAVCFGGTREEWKKRLLWVIPGCGLFAGFILYAVGLFGGGIGDMLEDISRLSRETELVSRWDYLCTQFTVLVIYLRLIVLPVGQNLDYYYPFKTGFLDGLTPLALAFLIGLTALAIWKRRRFPLFTFALFWFFVTLSVESSIIPISDAIFEHRMYLPLAGFALFAAWIPFRLLPKRRVLAVLICICIITALGTATYLRNRVWQNDLTLWADVLSKAPRNPRAALNLGNALGTRGRYDQALQIYIHILRSNPDSAKVHYNIGVVYEKRGEIQKAIAAYRQALQIDPRNDLAQAGLANILIKQGDTEEVLSHYRDVLRAEPRNANAHNRMGIIFLQKGDTDRALEHLDKAVRLDPENDEAHNNLGGVLETRGDLKDAADHYTEALVINPGNPEARANLSRVLVKAGDPVLASRCYTEALRTVSGDAELHMDFGITLSRLGDLGGAVEQLREAARLDPDSASARYNLGLAFFKQGKWGEAVEQLSESLRIRPHNHRAQFNLALALYGDGDFDGAIAHFEKAMHQEPSLMSRASYEIARAYARKGRVEESAKWLRKAVDTGFNDWNRIETDPDLEGIRETSLYKATVEGNR